MTRQRVSQIVRQIAMGSYVPDKPVIVPIPDDKRYRSWKTEAEPVANAVIIYMMDVSGSMGDEQKEIVRIEAFWIDTWLRRQYQGLESRYIIHDAMAKEVDRDTFFKTRESGGGTPEHELHDCGIVYYPEHPYFLCVMTRGGDRPKLAAAIADVSKVAYDGWNGFWLASQ